MSKFQNIPETFPDLKTHAINHIVIAKNLVKKKKSMYAAPSPSSKLIAILSLTMPEVVLEEASLMTEQRCVPAGDFPGERLARY